MICPSSIQHLSCSPRTKHFVLLFFISFLLRAAVFLFFIQPHGYYKQPDSVDYHTSAASIAYGVGMHRPDNGEPIFWRTPGYPLYLAFFYTLFGLKSFDFKANAPAQSTSIWIQILFSSLIPIIIFFLAFMLTQTYLIAWASSLVAVFHPGMVLASTYLLTEGIALVFFYLFLLFLYPSTRPNGLPQDERGKKKQRNWIVSITLAALMLSVYTWMRPMGEIIAIVSTGLLLFCARGSWKISFKKGTLFFLVFFASISPWYVRNYQLTGEWFFCPTSGPYFNCFCAPKILRRISNKPLEECHKLLQQAAGIELHKKRIALQGTGTFVSPLVCKKVAVPLLLAHPWYFMYDWAKEVVKTTFDLYASQLVAMANGSYFYDPIEEFLTEKIAACLYAEQMPLFMRLVAWLEFIFSLFLWFGIFAGSWLFLIKPLFFKSSTFIKKMQWLWFTTGIMIGAAIAPSGGFGYARLRLPVEPLLIILSLTFWYWTFYKEKMNLKI